MQLEHMGDMLERRIVERDDLMSVDCKRTYRIPCKAVCLIVRAAHHTPDRLIKLVCVWIIVYDIFTNQ